MDTFLGRFKNLIVLAAILFAQIVGLAVQIRRPTDIGETRLIRLWAVSAVTPFESAIIHSNEWVKGLWTNYAYLRGVRRENRALRAQLEQMKIEEARLSEDARMARRVQALLAFKEQYVDSTVAAQVIGTSGSDQSRVLYIDKGAKQGIAADMAVITPTGIVGKIVQVFPDSAQVLPINDQFSGVGAALKDSRLQGILKGTANGATTLQYIMSDEKVTPGEEVVTSGGDRIFPKGLPVGKVVSVEPGKDLFLNIRVIPAARLDQLEEVLVVTKITEKMPDVKDLGPLRASDILAERLPTVPPKPQADAAGTAKPGEGTAANGAAAPSAGTAAGARPAATAASKLAVGAASANKPAGTTNAPRTAAAGASAVKPKPPATTTNPPSSAAEKPSGDAGAAKPSPTAGAETNGDVSTPAPERAKPAPESVPGTPAEQPSTPPAGVPPQ
ncbi:MAG TPA: rod shape-determining protein MreC [Terriglobales bacterium]|jgi:rod shape-determining protein MreC|nr:rod shape-determining protein MreC [Terriglobales bacterium]